MSSDTSSPSVLWERVEESAGEADFLWQMWERALRSEAYNLRKVSRWAEDRLLGALDGIRAGGQAAFERITLCALAGNEPMSICVAACTLAQDASPQAVEALSTELRQAEGPALSSLRRGMELAASPSLLSTLRTRLRGAAAPAQAALIEAYAFAGIDPGFLLAEAAASGDPVLLRAVLRVGLRLPQLADHAFVMRLLESRDPSIVDAAIATGLVLGLPAALRCLRDQTENRVGSRLLAVLACIGGTNERARLMTMLSNKEQCKGAVVALGFSGTQDAADACVELLRNGIVPRLAADAFCTVTGLDLQAHKLIAPEPDADEELVSLDRDGLNADLSLTDEDTLPLPNIDGIIVWWNSHRTEFAPGIRYLAGHPANRASLWQMLADGPMRRRPALAFEVAIRTQGQWLTTDAFTTEQQHQLQRLEALQADAYYRSPLLQQMSTL